MTHFKLYLLTPQFRDNATVFMEDQITEFYPQLDQDQHKEVFYNPKNNQSFEDINNQRQILWNNNHKTFAYSYNEKIDKEQNAQKTLTFEMNRYISVENEWRENPFARNITIGSIILLREFSYKEVSEEILFTVKSIKYDFKENNTIYSITCQDSFTYQSVHQNEGYTINNDPSSADFIGAKTIDWWIINKIMPECHMNYTYLSMQTGLYLTKQGHYYTFDINEYDNIQIPNNEEILKIIKEPYSSDVDKDYFESFSFSCSGSNANAALIAVADLINFQINTFEHSRHVFNENNNNLFDLFFWVEPKQNDKRLGLKYTPVQSIKSFGLSHKGDSLTTVLNVQGPTIDDEIISLIPTVPSFFSNLFLSGALWDKSSYIKGYFSNICKHSLYINYSDATANIEAKVVQISLYTNPNITSSSLKTDATIIKQGEYYDSTAQEVSGWYNTDSHYRYFPLYSKTPNKELGIIKDNGILIKNYLFETPFLYDKISFSWEELKSVIFRNTTINDEVTSVPFYNNGSLWQLVLHDLDTNEIYYIREGQSFSAWTTHSYRAFICITVDKDIDVTQEKDSWSNPTIYLNFYREPTDEDLEFAEVADNCPWLENKLIDFSYFYTNRIINDSEYQELMHLITNQLRIINGKLLIYTTAYYNALHQETQILADLQNKLDILGAECQTSIIDPCAFSVAPSLDLNRFKQTYLNITNTNNSLYVPILNHTTLLEEYFNKYFNTQQRFLKNIKNFRDYFNATNNFAAQGLYKYEFNIDLPDFESLLLKQSNAEEIENNVFTSEVTFYSFNKIHFNNLTSNFKYYTGYNTEEDDITTENYGDPQVPIYRYIAGKGYNRIKVASKRNYKDLYLPRIPKGQMMQCGSAATAAFKDTIYNNKRTYYDRVIKIPVRRDSINSDKWYIDKNGTKYYVGLTYSDLTYERTIPINYQDPRVYPWHGFYQVYSSSPRWFAYVAGKEFKINLENPTTGFLYCEILGHLYDNTTWPSTYSSLYFCTMNVNGQIYSPFSIHDMQSVVIEYDFSIITFKQIVNRYLFDKDSTTAYLRHKKTYTRSGQEIPSWFPEYACRGLVSAISSDTNIDDPTAAWDGSNDNEIYIRHFPIKDFYVYARKYKTISSPDCGYQFYCLNKAGENQGDYYESLQTDYILDNPFDYYEYQPIKLVNPDNESNFYRRIHGNVAGRVWSGIGTGIVSLGFFLVPGYALLGASAIAAYDLLWKFGPTWWDKKGLCNSNFFGGLADGSTALHNGYYNYTDPVYGLDKNSFDTYTNIREIAIGNNANLGEIPITKWEESLYKYAAKGFNSNRTALQLISQDELNKQTISNPLYYNLIGNNIGGTYNYVRSQGLYYPTRRATYLSRNSYIHKNGIYKIIWWHTNGQPSSTIRNLNHLPSSGSFNYNTSYIDLIAFYPLENIMLPLDISQLDWDNHTTYTLEEALTASGYTILSSTYGGGYSYSYVIKNQHNDGLYEGVVSFFSIEEYTKEYLKKFRTSYPLNIYSSSNKIYDYNNVPIDFETREGLVTGLYYSQEEDADFQKVSDFEEIPDFDPQATYYDENGERVYTIYQLMHGAPFDTVYLLSQYYSEELLSSDIVKFCPTLVKNTATLTYQKIINSTTQEPEISWYRIDSFKTENDSFLQEIDFTYGSPVNINIAGIEFQVNMGKTQIAQIKGLTNGAFWYLYHNSVEHPLLLQHAALIETQLTSYWTTAYTASKYCEYFLPEHWQPEYDTKTNNFASALFTITPNFGNFIITVSSKILPEVNIVTNNKGETRLKRYLFKRISRLPESIPTNVCGNFIDEITTKDASVVLQNNAAVLQAFEQIGENLDNWIVEEAGQTTYYYAEENTGMTWVQFLQEATKNSFDRYSGLYVMLYRILKEQYVELPMTEYHKYKQQHDHLWQVLQNKYSFMVLQDSYENTNATTSSELLKMAQYAFKNLNKPEAEYSLAVIHSNELKVLMPREDYYGKLEYRSYYGQEIRLGDGIKIDAQAYYNEYDQIYNSLSQYLFISKISYSLRNPIDISLTVNDVQYEDKIVQRLVKLMK